MKLDKKVRAAILERNRNRQGVMPPEYLQQHHRAVTVRSVGELQRTLPVLEILNQPAVENCNNCGACCQHMGYPPFWGMYEETEYLDQSDPRWLELREKHPELAAECRQGAIDGRGDKELPCIWFDPVAKNCKHHEFRPDVCRDFEIGGEGCLEHRERLGVQ